MPTDLTGEHLRRLHAEILPAFTPAGLDQVVFLTFAVSLETICGAKVAGQQAVTELLRWTQENELWLRLLPAIKLERPTRKALVSVCDEAIAYLTAPTPGGAVGVDALKSVLLTRKLPFVDRELVRDALIDMDQDGGCCGLVVVGSRQVGKSYCYEFLSFVRSSKWSKDHIVHINLERERAHSMPTRELAQRIARGITRRDAMMPQPLEGQTEDRFATYLAQWVATEADKEQERAWLVLDGFDHPSVPPANHSFLTALVAEAAHRPQLRVILLGYREFDPDTERNLHRHELSYLTRDQIQTFFEEMDRQLQYRAKPACQPAAEAADQLLLKYETLPVGSQAQLEAIRTIIPGVARELHRCAQLAPANGGAK